MNYNYTFFCWHGYSEFFAGLTYKREIRNKKKKNICNGYSFYLRALMKNIFVNFVFTYIRKV